MNCHYHPEKESKNFCSKCDKPLCEECSIDTNGKILCKDCIKEEVKKVYIKKKSPSLAAVLSLFPGLGAIYNGQILKGISFILIFASLLGLEDYARGFENVIFGLMAAGFYLYMIIDSYNSARAINLGLENASLYPKEGTTLFGLVLLLLGIAFMLANFELINYEHIVKLWPLIFIVIGAKMIYKWRKSSK